MKLIPYGSNQNLVEINKDTEIFYSYKTAVAGKWQLNGVQSDISNNQDMERPYKFGFDEYSLWWLNERGDRFSNPNIFQNGLKV